MMISIERIIQIGIVALLIFLGVNTFKNAQDFFTPSIKETFNPSDLLIQPDQRRAELIPPDWIISPPISFNIPLKNPRPDNRPLKKVPVKVKGIYMTGWTASLSSVRNNLISLVDKTELNSIVLDVKDDSGELTGDDLNIPLAKSLDCARNKADLGDLVQTMLDHGIYPIARIVCFKDPILAAKRPDLAVKTASGQLWRDNHGLAWVDPYNKRVWQYLVEVAKAAAKLGFREIQFDYVRFVSDGNIKLAVYPAKFTTQEDNIYQFLKYAKKELEPYNVFISADVFGLTTTAQDDLNIGQNFVKITAVVDYICPMVYPSHYAKGSYGFANPNAYPLETVYKSMLGGIAKNQGSIIRPWLQDFSLGYPRYGANEVIAQKKAVYKAGLQEWLLWNAGNRYTAGALDR